jgi:hypothetical protein
MEVYVQTTISRLVGKILSTQSVYVTQTARGVCLNSGV